MLEGYLFASVMINSSLRKWNDKYKSGILLCENEYESQKKEKKRKNLKCVVCWAQMCKCTFSHFKCTVNNHISSDFRK